MKLLIQQEFPNFTAAALMPDGSIDTLLDLAAYSAGRYAVLIFYPLDFNYISTSELRSMQRRAAQFTALNAAVVAISCDSYLAHQVWLNLPPEAGGLGSFDFPLVSDLSRVICRSADLLVADAVPEAATFILDREGKVVFQLRHDTAIARNIDRILGALEILNKEDHAETTPAEQIILLEENADRIRAAGLGIVAQSIDTDLDHPVWNELWKRFPLDADGKPALSFPFFGQQTGWIAEKGLTLVLREGLQGHGTGILLPDGSMMCEFHSERHVPRDFDEILRLGATIKQHLQTGEVIEWEAAGPAA